MIAEPELSPELCAIIHDRVSPDRYAAHMSAGKWARWRHLALIGEEVALCAGTPGGRLVVNVGPRWGKSELISYWTPIWYLAMYPHRCIMLGTASGLARHFGGKVRDELIGNPKHGVTLKEDTTAKNEWATPQGGGMKAVTVRESVMGRGANLLIVDDPYGSWEDAASGAYRRQVEEWFTATANSRLEPGASIVILHHRMHQKDLTNYVLTGPDAARWKHISLPSLAVENDILGRKPGESLCPERFGVTELEAKRIAARWSWEPMHQQNPQAMSAGAVYNRFSQRNVKHDLDIRRDLPVCATIDWNLNPGMHIEIGQHDPRTDVFTVVHEIHGPHMAIDGAAKELIRLYHTWAWKPELQLFGDATGVSMTDGKGYGVAMSKHLQSAGIRFRNRIPAGNPGVLESVLAVNDALADTITQEPRLFVHPRCERLLTDFAEVMPDDEGKPDKEASSELTHASDTIRYWVHYLRPLRTGERTTKRPRMAFGSGPGVA